MPTRRDLMQQSAAAMLLAPVTGLSSGAARANDAPLRFGVIADPQYAPVPPRHTRYYAHSLWKLSEAIADFNGRDLAFSVTLGDIIDRHWESYGHILPVYHGLIAPHAFVLGNHDFEVAGDYLASVHRVMGLERAYYDFEAGGVRFLVLDGNDISLFAHHPDSPSHAAALTRLAAMEAAGAVNAKRWNGGLSDAQFAWAEEVIRAATVRGERVIAMGHYPVHPPDPHNSWDDARLLELFSGYANVVMYLNGHNHAGNYGYAGGTHFLNLKGMVETPDTTAYGVVTVHDDRIDIEGVGREESRRLAI